MAAYLNGAITCNQFCMPGNNTAFECATKRLCRTSAARLPTNVGRLHTRELLEDLLHYFTGLPPSTPPSAGPLPSIRGLALQTAGTAVQPHPFSDLLPPEQASKKCAQCGCSAAEALLGRLRQCSGCK